MIIQAGQLVEIKPINQRATRREFVAFHQVARIYLDELGEWAALLTDGSFVALLNGPEEM